MSRRSKPALIPISLPCEPDFWLFPIANRASRPLTARATSQPHATIRAPSRKLPATCLPSEATISKRQLRRRKKRGVKDSTVKSQTLSSRLPRPFTVNTSTRPPLRERSKPTLPYRWIARDAIRSPISLSCQKAKISPMPRWSPRVFRSPIRIE